MIFPISWPQQTYGGKHSSKKKKTKKKTSKQNICYLLLLWRCFKKGKRGHVFHLPSGIQTLLIVKGNWVVILPKAYLDQGCWSGTSLFDSSEMSCIMKFSA